MRRLRSGSPRSGGAPAALHRLALRAYPSVFRRRFSADLERIFEARVAEAARISAARFVLVLFFHLADAVMSGLAERIRLTFERRARSDRTPVSPTSRRTSAMTRESLVADIRLTVRQCRRAPAFSVLTVGCLALGIGANTAIFAVVQSVLVRPLPYAQPETLVSLWSNNARQGEPNNPVSPADFEALRDAPTLTGVEAMYSFLVPVQLRESAEPEIVQASTVTLGMLPLLGRAAAVGRTLQPGDPDSTVVLSHQFWVRRFGADPSIVNAAIRMTERGAPFTVVGVMPPDFVFPYRSMLGPSGFSRAQRPDVWLPLSRRDGRFTTHDGQANRVIHYLALIGRLAPGATTVHASTDLEVIAARRATEFPDTNAGWGVTVRPLHEQAVGSLRPALMTLMGGVGFVLLITCLNVANVLLARASGRRRELATRSALGASAGRLVQQILVESVLLAVVGGLLGIGLTLFGIQVILSFAPAGLPRIGEVAPSWAVGAFAFAATLLTGLLVGAVPALAVARAQDSVHDGHRMTASRARLRIRSVLIVAEVSLAMVLTVGTGLLLRSFVTVVGVDPGFDARRLLTMQVSVPSRFVEPAARLAFCDNLEARLRAIPGVANIGGTTRLPLGSTSVSTLLQVEGRAAPQVEWPEVELRRAVFDFFGTMEIPIVRGRAFTPRDALDSPGVVVVNTALASRVFSGEEPIGRRVRLGGSTTAPWLEIVGVVGSVRHASLEEVPRPELYVSYRQGPPTAPFLTARSSGEPTALVAAVRNAVREAGADPPTELRTMAEIRSASVEPRRFVLGLIGLFGGLALVLAAIGVYGVVTLAAGERMPEMGIRLALGARPVEIAALMLRQPVRLTAIGTAIGAALALAMSPVLASQLFGVRGADPLTYLGVTITLLTVATLAALVPARRAMRTDPAIVLKG